ncbi:MAG: hypothetical protein GX182_03675 [Firmicutes bacterium]|nr:hypothetical protein [Bacillota bacterium]
MATVPFGNNPEKVEGYRAFWELADVKRPLVGFSLKSWFPLMEFEASAKWQEYDYLTPEMIEPEAFVEDQERLLREGEQIDDDIFRGASPSQAVPWLCAMLGSPLRILPESILGEDMDLEWDEIEELELDKENPWFKKYIEFTKVLVESSAGRYPVSHGTLVGPSDLAGVVRGRNRNIFDMYDEPEKSSDLLWKTARIFVEVLEEQRRHIPTYHGGYFDAQYQLWTPGPTIRMQEDASGLFSPELYRRFLQPVDRWLASQYSHNFIHLHSTSMHILDCFLEIEELRCFQVNNDVSGPPIAKMVPYFQAIQRAKRPLLIRGSFTPDELRLLMDSLSPRGLYLYIMVESMEEIEQLRPIVGM